MGRTRTERKRAVRREVFARDNYTCQQCGFHPKVPRKWDGTIPLTNGIKTLTIDHMIEKALGGPSSKDNFVTLCDKCNIKKSIHVGQLINEGCMKGLTLIEARQRAARILALPT